MFGPREPATGSAGEFPMVNKQFLYKTTIILSTEAQSLPILRYGQYLPLAHSHITPGVAAMDSCFVLISTHQHDISSTVSLTITDPAFCGKVSAKHVFKSQLHHTHVVAVGWEPQAVLGKRMKMGSAFYRSVCHRNSIRVDI